MEGVLIGLENWSITEYFRGARWGYAFLNAAHIFGVALLVGATMPMNLRVLGCWPSTSQATVIRVLMPTAVFGLILAILAGLLLFAVRASEYAEVVFFQIKLLLILIGCVSALTLHWKYGAALEGASKRRRFSHAIVSLLCWPGALVLGRLIAFADTSS